MLGVDFLVPKKKKNINQKFETFQRGAVQKPLDMYIAPIHAMNFYLYIWNKYYKNHLQ